jgi:glutathione S-transferase
MSPHIVLEETGLPYQIERVDLKTKVTETGADYNAVNPKGYVPALVLDNGELLTEGPAIVQYLADQVPARRLAPANGTMERYRVQEWLTFTGTDLHKNFTPLFMAAPEEWKATVRTLLDRRLATASTLLGDKPYTVGDSFSVADAYLFTVLTWTDIVKIDISRWPNLIAFRARIAARPTVQAAMKAEGLIK